MPSEPHRSPHPHLPQHASDAERPARQGGGQLGAEKAEALLSARLAPDMFPLATQIRFASSRPMTGRGACAAKSTRRTSRISSTKAERWRASRHPGGGPPPHRSGDGASRQLRPRCARRRSGGRSDRPRPANGHDLRHDARRFARDWALSQIYFHVMAAYAILRNEELRDRQARLLCPYMFAYLRADEPS